MRHDGYTRAPRAILAPHILRRRFLQANNGAGLRRNRRAQIPYQRILQIFDGPQGRPSIVVTV